LPLANQAVSGSIPLISTKIEVDRNVSLFSLFLRADPLKIYLNPPAADVRRCRTGAAARPLISTN
jgi:hypothetical protein